MFLHQLGEHFVFLDKLLLQKGDLSFKSALFLPSRRSEGSHPVFKELFLPAIEERRLKFVLVAELRHWNVVYQVATQNRHFLLGAVVESIFSRHSLLLLSCRLRRTPLNSN